MSIDAKEAEERGASGPLRRTGLHAPRSADHPGSAA